MKMRMTEEVRNLLKEDWEAERVAENKPILGFEKIIEELNRPLIKGYIFVSRRTADWIMGNLLWCRSDYQNYCKAELEAIKGNR